MKSHPKVDSTSQVMNLSESCQLWFPPFLADTDLCLLDYTILVGIIHVISQKPTPVLVESANLRINQRLTQLYCVSLPNFVCARVWMINPGWFDFSGSWINRNGTDTIHWEQRPNNLLILTWVYCFDFWKTVLHYSVYELKYVYYTCRPYTVEFQKPIIGVHYRSTAWNNNTYSKITFLWRQIHLLHTKTKYFISNKIINKL